jgi:hypothetical protein
MFCFAVRDSQGHNPSHTTPIILFFLLSPLFSLFPFLTHRMTPLAALVFFPDI